MIQRSAILIVLVLLAPSPLSAHAYLVKSVPAARAVLFRAPERVQLWFNERLEPRYSSITVNDQDGKPVETGKTEVGAEDPKLLSATLKSLSAGRYIVRYRVLSVDGHIVQDEFPFTIKR
jgi:methionine-rich copper-binding protein CopC